MLGELKSSDFATLVGERFEIRFNEEVRLEAELLKVEALGGEADVDGRPFSVIFRTGQQGAYFPQHIYHLAHPKLGELALFLVPIGPDRETKGMLYEAVFS